MTDRHRNDACQCFAGAPALAAAALMPKAGWAKRQTESLADMICVHMNGHITPADGHEAQEVPSVPGVEKCGCRGRQVVEARQLAPILQENGFPGNMVEV